MKHPMKCAAGILSRVSSMLATLQMSHLTCVKIRFNLANKLGCTGCPGNGASNMVLTYYV